MAVTLPKNRRQHFDNVARVGCIICAGPATIHHVHGESIKARLTGMGYESSRSASQRAYGDALVLPLCHNHHQGAEGFDGSMGQLTWEARYGSQAALVDEVSQELGYSMWALWEQWHVPSKIVGRR